MITVKSKRCKIGKLLKDFTNAEIIDVTSHAADDFIKLSPFYPHGDIPVPFSNGVTSYSVEGVWQGLKVFESADIDVKTFTKNKMKGLKRTERRFGHTLGHRKGVNGTELLGYLDAKKQIYLPTYRWMLENKAFDLIKKLRAIAAEKDIVLLDYETSCEIDSSAPLSHANLVKCYVERIYPFEDAL